ncbi:DUF5050 domain-containing protein [bacterium]|nr:DUF5050 domain-containing protein [bacterium]
MLKIKIGAIFLSLVTCFTCTIISAKTSYLEDDYGNDAWTSFLHDHSNSDYSSTVISQEPEILDTLYHNEGDTFYGAIIYDGILIATYSNMNQRVSGVVAYDIEGLEVVWESELSERFCFTTPAFNPEDNTIFVATTDGYNIRGESSSTIVCIDIDDGEFKWENDVDGAIFQPLVYANDLVFYTNYYCNGDDVGTQSEPGDIGCLDADDGSQRWYKTMKYSFDDHSQLMAINGNQVLVPNTFLTHQEDNIYSAGDESVFYSFNQSTGSKNWEILKKNSYLPALSVDEDKLYLTYSAEDDDSFAQKLEAYDFDRNLQWTYEINGSIGWCSTPIFNDQYIFLRTRTGKVYCIDKSTGKRIWTSPKDKAETEEMQIQVEGRVYDEESRVILTLNGEELYVDSKGYFEYYYDLSYGENTLEFEAENNVGLTTSKVLTVYRFDPDTTAPEITITYPQPNQNVYETPLTIQGSATDEGSGVKSVTVNEKAVTMKDDGAFEASVSLILGKNTIRVEAVDYKGNKGSKTIYVQYLEKKPVVILLWIGNRIALVDTEPVTLDTPPLIYKGRAMVPVRFIAEAFGADVFFDAAEQEIDIAFGAVYISLWVNKTWARIEVTENGQRNNKIVTLDAPPIIRNGRTLVPVRFIAEAFGATIDWDGKEKKITITLLVDSQGGNPPPPPEEEVNQRGNSVGNIVNSGIVAQQGEWVYYSNFNDDRKLYKIRTDGTGRTKLNEDNSYYINVVGEWIYYHNNSDEANLYKIRTDGTGRTKLNEDMNSNYINVVGEWIYYTFSISGNTQSIYKIRTDGTGRTKLNDDISMDINVVGEWIYYHNYSDKDSDKGKLYKIRTDGTGRTKLSEDDSYYINVVGEWVYYSNGSDGYKLYKIRTDGNGRTKLNEDNSDFINVVEEWVYYSNGSDGEKLYKIRTDGTGRTKVN